MQLGIDKNNGRIYEGGYANAREVMPTPTILPCKFCSHKTEIAGGPESTDSFGSEYIFMQEYFDSKSRIRSGYVLKRGESQPWRPVIDGRNIDLCGYYCFSLWHQLSISNTRKMYFAFGDRNRFTVWVLVDIEVVFSGAELVTLKALSSFGALPELVDGALPEAYEGNIRATLQHVVDELYVASAESVVDHCREAATAVISAFLKSHGKDLGKLVGGLRSAEPPKNLTANCADTIAKLHSRRKTAEKQSREFRHISDEDAQLAVSCLGTIICELGYGRW